MAKIMTTQELNDHVEIVRAAHDRAQTEPTNTTVAAALTAALDNPKNFNGRKVIARESATYVHPSSAVKSPATSKNVDRVLLENDAEIFQCRICGSTWSSVLSAVGHSSAHARTAAERSSTAKAGGAASAEARARKAKETMTQTKTTKPATPRDVAQANTPDPAKARDAVDGVVHTMTTRVGGTVHPDVHEIVRNVRALAHQAIKMSEALAATAAAIIALGAKLNTQPEVSEEELADLRSKADQLDMLKNLLNK